MASNCLFSINKHTTTTTIRIPTIILLILMTVNGRLCGLKLATRLDDVCDNDLDCTGVQLETGAENATEFTTKCCAVGCTIGDLKKYCCALVAKSNQNR